MAATHCTGLSVTTASPISGYGCSCRSRLRDCVIAMTRRRPLRICGHSYVGALQSFFVRGLGQAWFTGAIPRHGSSLRSRNRTVAISRRNSVNRSTPPPLRSSSEPARYGFTANGTRIHVPYSPYTATCDASQTGQRPLRRKPGQRARSMNGMASIEGLSGPIGKGRRPLRTASDAVCEKATLNRASIGGCCLLYERSSMAGRAVLRRPYHCRMDGAMDVTTRHARIARASTAAGGGPRH